MLLCSSYKLNLILEGEHVLKTSFVKLWKLYFYFQLYFYTTLNDNSDLSVMYVRLFIIFKITNVGI